MGKWKNIFLEDKSSDEEKVTKVITKKGAPTMPSAFGAPSAFHMEMPSTANRVIESFASEISPPTFDGPMQVSAEMVAYFEKYLDKINKPGYDFLELYRVVKNINDQSTFTTAFNVASSFAPLTKQQLITDADFYIDSVRTVVKESKDQAKSKLDKLQSESAAKDNAFNASLNECKNRLQKVKAEYDALLSNKPNLHAELVDQTGEVNATLNELIRYEQTLISSLIKVKTNIQNFL